MKRPMNEVVLLTDDSNDIRIALGLDYLEKALAKTGYTVSREVYAKKPHEYRDVPGYKIYVGVREQDDFLAWMEEKEILIYHTTAPEEEGFYLENCPGHLTIVAGGTNTGALYGCLELAERIEKETQIPAELSFGDAPAFKLRGPAIGLQKTKIEPPRLTYEYPITPQRFPWFYDKAGWENFMEVMLEERCNILYLWTGHPFSSLIKLEDYPEALEVSEEVFQKNREMFDWITQECDRRGIWVVLKFYNIHIPLPFAEHHGLELRQSTITPLVADYTAKSITEFMKSFPHIGLMVCLGEALRGTENKTEWFVDTILPAVNKGVEEAGLTEAPPIILRGHDCDPYDAMTKGMEVYDNIYTMWKYNGEGLTTYYPRGEWQETHRSLIGLGEAHIINVHILANLEPFRFNAPNYIQKCTQAAQNRLGANGLHLYPMFFWDWPISPDKTEPRLKQLDRDWMWYKAWMRYAWNPDRNELDEEFFWNHEIAQFFDCDTETAEVIRTAMENSGQCAPRILGRVGITEGNRQTMSLGMTMSQFTNVFRYRPNLQLWDSVARVGEQPDDYIKNMLEGNPHIGETPLDMIEDVTYFATTSLEEINSISPDKLGENAEEFARIQTDIKAIYLMTLSYCEKIKAALSILEYKYTMDKDCMGDLSLLENALPSWEKSMEYYRELAELTEKTYHFANSMQTRQRKIPFTDGDKFGHWTQCLPEYEAELKNFKMHLARLQDGIIPGQDAGELVYEPLTPVPYKVLSDHESYTIEQEESIFTDCDFPIKEIAGELEGLEGVRFGLGPAIEDGISLEIEFLEDSLLLIGYINSGGVEWLQVPELETNTHADDRGGLDVVYANALKVQGTAPVNIHAFRYDKGTYTIYFGTGAYVVAGVVSAEETLAPRDAELIGEALDSLDWMYEEELK